MGFKSRPNSDQFIEARLEKSLWLILWLTEEMPSCLVTSVLNGERSRCWRRAEFLIYKTMIKILMNPCYSLGFH